MEDYDKIKKYCWYKNQQGYPTARINQVPIKMHQFLNFKYYDHINRNKLDNRKSNFRSATNQENVMNSSLSKNNSSGIIGVYYNKRDKVWYAQIMLNKKTINLGSSKIKEDAIKIRLQGELKYFGEFAPQRDLFEKYSIA